MREWSAARRALGSSPYATSLMRMCLKAYSSSVSMVDVAAAWMRSRRASVWRSSSRPSRVSFRCATAPDQKTPPTTAACCAAFFSRGGSWSTRASISDCRLLGTGSDSTRSSSLPRPRSAVPTAASMPTVSSRKSGLPPALRRRRSTAPAGRSGAPRRPERSVSL